jgi:hypothetical protein
VHGPRLVLFSAVLPNVGRELCWLDPVTKTAGLVKDVHPTGDSNPSNFTRWGDYTYFSADDGTNFAAGRGVFRTDGTKVEKISTPGLTVPLDYAQLGPWPVIAGKALIMASTAATGTEPHFVQGSGVTLVKDLTPGPGSTDVKYVGSLNGRWYLVTSDGTLWEIGYDGVPRPIATKVDPSQPISSVGDTLLVMIDGGPSVGIELHGIKLYATATAYGLDETLDTPCTAHASAPELGKTMQVASRTAQPGGVMVTLIGVAGTPLRIPGLGELFLDPFAPIQVLGAAPVQGYASQIGVPLPNAARLDKLVVNIQNLHVDPSLKMQVSNPIRLKLGLVN